MEQYSQKLQHMLTGNKLNFKKEIISDVWEAIHELLMWDQLRRKWFQVSNFG